MVLLLPSRGFVLRSFDEFMNPPKNDLDITHYKTKYSFYSLIIGQCNTRVFIGLTIMTYEPLHHAVQIC